MTLQSVTGSKDLNPQQVEQNSFIGACLSEVYTKWGYEEVSPPFIERLETLMAGGAIPKQEIIKLVSDDEIGLIPEMTCSIVRMATTRLANKPRPLRLWAKSTILKKQALSDGDFSIEENIHSGVELITNNNTNIEEELLYLLIDSLNSLKLKTNKQKKLLIGHTILMDIILKNVPISIKDETKQALQSFDLIKLVELNKSNEIEIPLRILKEVRGSPLTIISKLKSILGENIVIEDIERLFKSIEPIGKINDVDVILDPTFQPHFKLYTGLVFQLIVQNEYSNLILARGGRYDDLVQKFSKDNNSSGAGFTFSIENIREIKEFKSKNQAQQDKILIAYGGNNCLGDALSKQKEWHKKGYVAVVEFEKCRNIDQANELRIQRGFKSLDWIENN